MCVWLDWARTCSDPGLRAVGQSFPVIQASLRAWPGSAAHTLYSLLHGPCSCLPAERPRPALIRPCLQMAMHLVCLVSYLSPFSWWPFLFWFPSCPEHTMATPLEDVGKQVGRSCPLPVAPKGLLRASRRLSFLVHLAPRCGGVPCSWQTTSCSNGTSSKDAPCWSSGRARGWPASSRPPWHVPFTVQVGCHPRLRGAVPSQGVS